MHKNQTLATEEKVHPHREKHKKNTDDNRQDVSRGLKRGGHMQHLCLTNSTLFEHGITNQLYLCRAPGFFFFFFFGQFWFLNSQNLDIPVRLAAWMKSNFIPGFSQT